MQQKGQDNSNLENKFFCELHADCQLLGISFQEKYTRKSRLLCMKCTIDVLNKQEKVEQLVYIQDLIDNPADSILKATSQAESEMKINEIEALQEIEKLLLKIEDSFKKQLLQLRQNIKEMREQVTIMTKELHSNLKLNDLVKQFQLVRSMDSYQGTTEFTELVEQLNQISANLMKSYFAAKLKVNCNQQDIVNNYLKNFKTITNEVDQTNKMSLDLFNKIVSFEIPKIILDEIKQFPQIHFQISEGKQIQYQLLYQGTQHGMSAQNYWSICNYQTHLLTIMTSNNGNKFGGYSPCQIHSGLNNYVQDPTMKSFLFQYNKKEIYKIKNQQHAVYCNYSYGPTYGGHDIHVAANFNQGNSNGLGHSYDLSGYNITDPANHIFGSTQPNLQEIKVYQVTFI